MPRTAFSAIYLAAPTVASFSGVQSLGGLLDDLLCSHLVVRLAIGDRSGGFLIRV